MVMILSIKTNSPNSDILKISPSIKLRTKSNFSNGAVYFTKYAVDRVPGQG
jgi:hypothetical protein